MLEHICYQLDPSSAVSLASTCHYFHDTILKVFGSLLNIEYYELLRILQDRIGGCWHLCDLVYMHDLLLNQLCGLC